MRIRLGKLGSLGVVIISGVLSISACYGGAGTARTKPASIRPAVCATSVPSATSRSAQSDLNSPRLKELAMELVSSAENSSLDWRGQYAYIEDIGDGRGYTGGIIGFTSGTHDMLELVKRYTADCPSNPLAGFIGALESVDGTDSHSGLGPKFIAAWKQAAKDPLFQNAQNDLRDSMYFHPAVTQAKEDGLGPLGQFIYYDAYVNHGPGNDRIACDAIPTGQKLAGLSFPGIRQIAMCRTRTPAQGGDEVKYLNAFLDARKARIQAERPDNKASRVEDMQRVFLNERNLDLHGTLRWSTYGDQYQYKN